MSRYIDADALKKDIARLHVLNDEAEIRRAYEYNPHVTSTDFEETLVSVFDAIDDTPSIDIEPKRGEWIVHEARTEVNDGFIDFFPTEYECSNCGLKQSMYFINSKPSNFCPNCGADMRGKGDD